MIDAIIFDTETTGIVDPQCLELAWQAWPDGEPFQSYYQPSKPCEWGALATHHITPDTLANAPHHSLAKLPSARYLIGHNVDFDWTVMGKPAGQRICTLALSRRLLPEIDSHKLGAVYYRLFGATVITSDTVRGGHSALDDVRMTAKVLNELITLSKVNNLEALWELSEDARIPRKMTFGKFAGQPISAVDRGYANWYRKQTDTDPYVVEAFRRAGLC